MKKIYMKFKNAYDKNTSMNWKDPRENLTPEMVKSAMDNLITADMFEKDGAAMYKEAVNAEIRETTVTKIF